MIPDSQYEWLYQQSEELDISVAEIVRRALDAWMKSQSVQDEDLFQSPYMSSVLFGGKGGNYTAAVEELRQVVKLLTRAVRRTAPPDVMQEFDRRLEEWRKRDRLSPIQQAPPKEEK